MYIWGFQQHFQVSINTTAKEIFKELKLGLNPEVWVVGIWGEDNGLENPNPVDIVTIDTPFEPKLFSDVNQIAKEIYEDDPNRAIIISDVRAENKYHQKLKLKAKVNAMNKVLSEEYEGLDTTFNISMPVKIRGFWVFIILKLSKEAVKTIPSLNKSNVLGRYEIKKSLLEATISNYLRACSTALQIPDVGEELNVLNRNGLEFIRSAGEVFLNSLAFKFHGHHFNLFDLFNLISSQYYEGAESSGRIIIAQNEHPAINVTLKFSDPINLSNHKAIRKLLEMTNDTLSLIANGNEVYGIGYVTDYDFKAEDLFVIEFNGHFKWELKHHEKILMVVEYNQPRLPKERIGKELFSDHFSRIFSSIKQNDIDTVWEIILAATEQKHGTMVVISNKADEEAVRLNGQCIIVEPIHLTSEIMRLVTAIDGAVLLDPNGECHALGVILDGLASDKGDSARGARFNSAMRYLETQDNECLIVVVSEDGHINLIPYLKPRIPRQWIDDLIKDLHEVNDSRNVDIKVFNQTMHNVRKLEFYLFQEDCDVINKLRENIESKIEPDIIKIVYPDFIPNPEMNKNYYIYS
jgi:DNA integrity scanning protein DisA with diadenylate cyclase activity